jgi:hypothetical protein
VPEMWGTPAGTSARQADDYAAAINDLNIKQSLGQIAMQPSIARQNAAQAESMELNLKQQKDRAEMLKQFVAKRAAGQTAGPPGNPADPLDSLTSDLESYAELGFASGNPDEGMKMAEGAARVQQQRAAARLSQTNDKIKTFEFAKTLSDEGMKLLANAHDQQSWDQAKAGFKQMLGPNARETGFENVPYSPEAVEAARNQLMTIREQAQTKIEQARLKNDEENKKSEEKRRDIQNKLTQAETRVANARAEKLAREGGGNSKVPARLVKDATDYIKKDYSGVSDEQVRISALPIAERAQELMAKNSAMRESEAVAQAYKEAKSGGTFKDMHRKGAPTAEQVKAQQDLVQKYNKMPQYSHLAYDPKLEYKEVEENGVMVLKAKKRPD